MHMLIKEKIKTLSLSFLLLLALFVLLPAGVSAASYEEVKTVTRVSPVSFGVAEEVEIILNIDGSAPLAVGIVETIPEGFSFPEEDAEVSGAKHFEVDREAGKIVFAVIDEKVIKYRVISSEPGKGTFAGEWVDLLLQSPELDEGKERWKPVSDPNIVPSVERSESEAETTGGKARATSESETSAPGFGSGFTCLALLICFCLTGLKTRGGK